MLTPRLTVPVMLGIVLQPGINAKGQTSASVPASIAWMPTMTDRQACKVGPRVSVTGVAEVSETVGGMFEKLLVYKAELPESGLVFAGSVSSRSASPKAPSEIECIWHIDHSRYLRSSNLKLGPDKRAVRIDVENLTGEVQMAVLVGAARGKVKPVLAFRSSEICPPDLAPGWNYSRTMTILPSENRVSFYDVRIDTRTWCTKKNGQQCNPQSGPQDFTTSEVMRFDKDKYTHF
jgi:hypothetical protein